MRFLLGTQSKVPPSVSVAWYSPGDWYSQVIMLAALGLGKVQMKRRHTREVESSKKNTTHIAVWKWPKPFSKACIFHPLQSAQAVPSHLLAAPSSNKQPTQPQEQSKPQRDCAESNSVLALEEVVTVWLQPSEWHVYLIQVISQSDLAGY